MQSILSPPIPETLDTLAQLMRNPEADLLKKAKRKALTVFLAGKLIDLNSKNIQAYRNMYYCNSVLQQEGQELKTSYCKNRMCMVCNSIKTANLINGYLPELQKMTDPQFVTMTVKAVYARQLHGAITKMQKDFRAITMHLRKYKKLQIKAIRKLECNHNKYFDVYDPEYANRYQNAYYDTYNPHFHMVIDGRVEAELFLAEWMLRNPNSNDQAQKIIPADQNSFVELFKYATKIVAKNGTINPRAIDIIYSAMHRRRVVQPVGIKKVVDEDEREKTIYPQLTDEVAQWQYDAGAFDWINPETGETLTGFTPPHDMLMLFEQLRE